MLIVLTTIPDDATSEALASKLVTEKLAACVQILPPMTSVYVWEGEVQRETEHLLLIKTKDEHWPSLLDLITKEHPYDVPEIVAIKGAAVSQKYANWLTEVLRPE